MPDQATMPEQPSTSDRDQQTPLVCTYNGFVSSTMDAILLFEAALAGSLSHISRRPHDRERASLIKSGHVFVYEESSSGIKRWTDGVSWSPSRILGNFLIYRELDKPFKPGEKKRAMKKRTVDGNLKSETTTAGADSYNTNSHQAPSSRSSSLSSNNSGANATQNRDAERALIGSLVDSYQFKEGGLIKKTISILYQGVHHHMVSYYSIEDAISGRLVSPSADPMMRNIAPRHELIANPSFRTPVEDSNFLLADTRFESIYTMQSGGVGYVSSSPFGPRAMSAPDLPSYPPGWTTTHGFVPSGNYPLTGEMNPVGYTPQAINGYAYDQNYNPVYRMPVLDGRRSSALAGPIEDSHLHYEAPMGTVAPVTNGYTVNSYSVPHTGLDRGSMFEPSGAPQTSAYGPNPYDTEVSHHLEDAYDDDKFRDPSLDDPIEPSLYHSTANHHQQISGLGSLSGSTVFTSSGHNTTPSGVPLSLEETDPSSPTLPEHMTSAWPSTLAGSDHY